MGSAGPLVTGRIFDILQDTSGDISLVVLDVFQIASVRDEIFGTPVLVRRFNEKTTLIVSTKVRQLDCSNSKLLT